LKKSTVVQSDTALILGLSAIDDPKLSIKISRSSYHAVIICTKKDNKISVA